MNKLDQIEDARVIFGMILLISNKIDKNLEREIKEFDITAKQWFLSLVLDNLFHEPPTISEVANELGYSHQNIKQITTKLKDKGLLKLIRDENDKRVTRIVLTDYSKEFWNAIKPSGDIFMSNLFSGITDDDLSIVRKVLRQMDLNLSVERIN